MNILFGICIVLGILSLIYYCIITIYAGLCSTFSWFWLAIGIGCILFSIVIKYMIRMDIRLEGFWKVFIITIITVGSTIFTLIEATVISHAKRKAEQGMDYLIVLGAQVKGRIITKSLKRRLDTAVIYLKENHLTVVIVSGGRGNKEDISEAEAMKKYLIEKGIEKKRIIKEDKSTNTYENICFSKSLMKENSVAAIVTNGFHIYRSINIAKKQGLEQIQGLAAPSDQVLLINYYVREAIGVLKDKLLGNL